jgi:hypothetical protein
MVFLRREEPEPDLVGENRGFEKENHPDVYMVYMVHY